MTGDDLDGRAVFFALGNPVLVQRRPVGGAEVLADFKAQVIRIFGNGEGFKELGLFLLLSDQFGKVLAHFFVDPFDITGRR